MKLRTQKKRRARVDMAFRRWRKRLRDSHNWAIMESVDVVVTGFLREPVEDAYEGRLLLK
jgi:hypothetical protein